ncbi:unnamed protein product [Clonostachys solani]|uniref:Major facilitator superfamily (MFS) profile domain-containing protein n=1 Tax=Clonostachys solani TaxID=160281 RepID=A0A9N9YYV9_9HYPO|nr:unnamed protein product [Clonostachys solani]
MHHPSITTDPGTATSAPTAILEVEEPGTDLAVSKSRTIAIISCVTCITGISNLLAGLLTVCIPVTSADLGIPPALQLWPASAFALACGCTLLLCGTVTDVLGCRRVCFVGTLVQAASAVGIISRSFPAASRPRSRSAAFSVMGGGQAMGFGLGLVLGGIFSDTIGWRWGFYTTGILNGAILALALWELPSGIDGGSFEWAMVVRLPKEIDWVGAVIVRASLALLSYELAVFSRTHAERHIRQPLNLALLCVAFILLPVFGIWMHFQTKRGRPALVPNSLWTNGPFTAGALNASEQLTTLYLQGVRGFSALTSSVYLLPAPICGALMNVAVAIFLSRLNPSFTVAAGCLAMALNPLGADLIYVIANLVVTAAFPVKLQALAGGVFRMLSQIGKSVGIATTAVIAQHIATPTQGADMKEEVLRGYKAGWWYNCGMGFEQFW